MHHKHFMRNALNMARRGIGRTAPNPSVGCVIVKNGLIVARAGTADKGRPHAETQALKQAGAEAKGATLYVTLEPCSHHGQTPPCTDAIIKAGIKTVVIGCADPTMNSDALQKAGIEIVTGVLEQECSQVNAGFILNKTQNRPYVTLKCASTLDGKIAVSSGESKYITGALARRHVHLLRSQHDAIMVGKNTGKADKPQLTTRLEGLEHDPLKIILGESDLQSDPHDIKAVLTELAERGVTRLLVEGGAQVHTSFLKSGLFDELLIYRAPTLLGQEHKGMAADLNITTLAQRFDLRRKSVQLLGQDILERYIAT